MCGGEKIKAKPNKCLTGHKAARALKGGQGKSPEKLPSTQIGIPPPSPLFGIGWIMLYGLIFHLSHTPSVCTHLSGISLLFASFLWPSCSWLELLFHPLLEPLPSQKVVGRAYETRSARCIGEPCSCSFTRIFKGNIWQTAPHCKKKKPKIIHKIPALMARWQHNYLNSLYRNSRSLMTV